MAHLQPYPRKSICLVQYIQLHVVRSKLLAHYARSSDLDRGGRRRDLGELLFAEAHEALLQLLQSLWRPVALRIFRGAGGQLRVLIIVPLSAQCFLRLAQWRCVDQLLEEALVPCLLYQMDKQELSTGWYRSLALDVILLKLSPILVVLRPGARLGRVQCVEMEE